MLGTILDYLYVLSQNGVGDIPKKLERISIKEKDTDDFWICFLPEAVLRFEFIKRKIAYSRKLDIYVIPKAAIQPNPSLTREFLERVTEEAINQNSKEGRKINLLGISLGNAPAYKLANVFHVDRFVSVVPGSFLPECIWESIATRRMAENSGYNLNYYKEALDDFSPIRNLDSLSGKFLGSLFGTF